MPRSSHSAGINDMLFLPKEVPAIHCGRRGFPMMRPPPPEDDLKTRDIRSR